MFRIDDDVICDATEKGSLARFINHGCGPNCYTQIIAHGGTKKIVIYAKHDVHVNEARVLAPPLAPSAHVA